MIRAVFLVVSAGLSFIAQGQSRLPSAEELAKKMASSAKSITYAGVRTVTMPGSGERRPIEERVIRSRGRTYLSYYPGSPLEDIVVIERDGKRYTYNKKAKEIRVAPSRETWFDASKALMSAASQSTAKVSEGSSVAGRRTYLIEVSAPDQRGQQQMWVDREKFVVLKRSIQMGRSQPGAPSGGFEYSEIDFSIPNPDSKFEIPRGVPIITVADELKRLAKEIGVKPAMIKSVRDLELISVSKLEYKGNVILRQAYTYGERRISLFVMKETSAEMTFASSRFKAHRWNASGLTLVLLGELKESELKELAKNVKT